MVPSAGGRASQAARAVIVQSDARPSTILPYQCFGNAAVVRWVSANVELPLPGELVGRLTGCSGSSSAGRALNLAAGQLASEPADLIRGIDVDHDLVDQRAGDARRQGRRAHRSKPGSSPCGIFGEPRSSCSKRIDEPYWGTSWATGWSRFPCPSGRRTDSWRGDACRFRLTAPNPGRKMPFGMSQGARGSLCPRHGWLPDVAVNRARARRHP